MEIPIENIKTVKNIRTDINSDDLSDLMMSIKENGLIHPISIIKENGGYRIVCGHRRFLALKKLGRKSLVVGKEINVMEGLEEKDILILNASENIHRLETSPIELGKVCQDLKNLGLNEAEIAVRLAMSKTKIETAIELMRKVPEQFKKSIGYSERQNKKGVIPATVAETIVKLRIKKEDMVELFKLAKEENLTASQLNFISKMMVSGHSLKETLKARENYIVKYVAIVVNREKLEEFKEPFAKLIKDILKGDRERPKNLFY